MSLKQTFKRLLLHGFLLVAGLSFFGLFGVLSTWLFLKQEVSGDAVVTPNLIGLDVDAARKRAKALGLMLAVEEEQRVHSVVVPEGRILLQIPKPGKQIKQGRVLKTTLSAGKKKQLIPKLEGERLNYAGVVLDQLDMRIDKVTQSPSLEQEKGRVLAQNPAEGDELRLQEGVSMLVSTGPEPQWYVTPGMEGRHYLPVKAELEKKGFRVIVKHKAYQKGAGPIIIHQNPLQGYPMKKDQTVVLEVNKDW